MISMGISEWRGMGEEAAPGDYEVERALAVGETGSRSVTFPKIGFD